MRYDIYEKANECGWQGWDGDEALNKINEGIGLGDCDNVIAQL